ncbi:MAG: sigma-70 family RNA polymerase sigma factor [Deltaproteobacteria bacterium]|nr:sigma-70 family RNA polymerase sigma factor [Deltaproteobacteria bacterium]
MIALEKQLVKKLKLRDEKAFEQLIEQYKSHIFNLLFRMIGNREEAEDLLQEVFITVFKKIESFREDSALSTWIYSIATNLCINRKQYLKRKKHYDKSSIDDLGSSKKISVYSQQETSATPLEVIEGRQMEKIIQEIILSMDEEYRVVIVLRDIQNLSYEEIGEILNVPPGTVKSRLHRGRMELKERLAPYLR